MCSDLLYIYQSEDDAENGGRGNTCLVEKAFWYSGMARIKIILVRHTPRAGAPNIVILYVLFVGGGVHLVGRHELQSLK